MEYSATSLYDDVPTRSMIHIPKYLYILCFMFYKQVNAVPTTLADKVEAPPTRPLSAKSKSAITAPVMTVTKLNTEQNRSVDVGSSW